MVDVKAVFAKAEREIDRLSSGINDNVSFDRFVSHCDDVVSRIQTYIENGNAPMGVKFSL